MPLRSSPQLFAANAAGAVEAAAQHTHKHSDPDQGVRYRRTAWFGLLKLSIWATPQGCHTRASPGGLRQPVPTRCARSYCLLQPLGGTLAFPSPPDCRCHQDLQLEPPPSNSPPLAPSHLPLRHQCRHLPPFAITDRPACAETRRSKRGQEDWGSLHQLGVGGGGLFP